MRGNQRTSGELSRKEGGKIFGSGSRAPIAISILVKDGSDKHELRYHDIGDYLSQKEKLNIISDFNSIQSIEWSTIQPDINNDWLNQRDPNYQFYAQISNERESPFLSNAVGVSTNRDAWVSGFSRKSVISNSLRMIENYNEITQKDGGRDEEPEILDDKKIKWTRSLKNKFKKGETITPNQNNVCIELYRPFTKKYLFYQNDIIESPGQWYEKWGQKNTVIVTSGKGASKNFSSLASNLIPNMDVLEKGQGFMRYDNSDHTSELIPDNSNMSQSFANKIGLSQDDTFAYIYGLLNSREYQQKYANDLKKNLARIPIVKDKEKYVEVGKQLMDLHINYEEVPLYTGVEIVKKDNPDYRVTKMNKYSGQVAVGDPTFAGYFEDWYQTYKAKSTL